MTHNEKRQSWAKEGMIGLGGIFSFLQLYSLLLKIVQRIVQVKK